MNFTDTLSDMKEFYWLVPFMWQSRGERLVEGDAVVTIQGREWCCMGRLRRAWEMLSLDWHGSNEYVHIQKNSRMGAGDMTQSLQCLLYKREDLSSIPSIHCITQL